MDCYKLEIGIGKDKTLQGTLKVWDSAIGKFTIMYGFGGGGIEEVKTATEYMVETILKKVEEKY